MGNTSSTSSPSGTKIIQAKIRHAEKTGVLNLVGKGVGSSSSLWVQLVNNTALVEVLTTLDISRNQLKTLPVEIFDLFAVKTLTASQCELQSTPSLSAGLPRLSTLRLDHNNLEEHTLGALPPSLVQLVLSFNHFSSPPPTLLALTHIQVLDLSGNRLRDVTSLHTLVSLVDLKLDDNQLEELPVELARLRQLRRLSLRLNQLRRRSPHTQEQSIPREIFEDTLLEKLELKGNPLTNGEVLSFEGVDALVRRQRSVTEKAMHGGALVDFSPFGLD